MEQIVIQMLASRAMVDLLHDYCPYILGDEYGMYKYNLGFRYQKYNL
jgi:hypothetical protein